MGKRGPKPTPTETLKRRGSWRAKTRKNEPKAPSTKPQCPRGLTPRARACWRWLTAQLDAMGLLSSAEEKSIARYCEAYDLHQDALASIRRDGPMVKLYDGNGNVAQVVKNPLLTERGKLSAELLRLEQQFGLTPASRVGLNVAAPPPASDQNQGTNGDQSFFRPHIVG